MSTEAPPPYRPHLSPATAFPPGWFGLKEGSKLKHSEQQGANMATGNTATHLTCSQQSSPAGQPGTALSSFPGSSYQTFPQTFTVGGDHAYDHGHPGLAAPGYHGGPPKHTVYVVERHDGDGGGDDDSCLTVCSAVLCCCFLWDLLTCHH